MTAPLGNYVVRFRISGSPREVLPALKGAVLAHPEVEGIHPREVDVFDLGYQPALGGESGAVEVRGVPSLDVAVRIVHEAGVSISEPLHPVILEGDLNATKI